MISRRTLNEISNQSIPSCNSLIRSCVSDGLNKQALLLFLQMKQANKEPDNLTFPFLAKACAKLSNLRDSINLHTHIVKSSFSFDLFVQTAMVDMYIKCGDLFSARQVFDKMPERDTASWNVMIAGYAQMGHLDLVLMLYHRLLQADCKPDSITIISLIQTSANTCNLKMGRSAHCLGIRFGVSSDVSAINTLISMYAKCDDFESAESIFYQMGANVRTVVSWNALITGYCYVEKFGEALKVFDKMCCAGTRPDLSTVLSLLSLCARSIALFQGTLIHGFAIKLGFGFDISVVNTLISMYSKCRDLQVAKYLFDKMPVRSSVSWTAMICGYAQDGDVDEAMELFLAMEAANERPDAVTVVAMLSGCSQTGALEIGRWLDRYAVVNRFDSNIIVTNALIDMYGKCGSLVEARKVFNRMCQRNVISWTCMIAGCAMNGECEDALVLFSEMIRIGLEPNHVTFLAVLSACSHAGFLEKGWECFDLMTREYQTRPGLEHYACMADLLGRRGKLREALDFIRNMPIEPDAGVWGALLGACRTHKDIELGEYVADRLLKLEPENAVSYVTMANFYAAGERWEGVAKVRVMMKCHRVKKVPGQSVVRVDGKAHVFTVEDRCHPQSSNIYETLDGLALQLKEAGFEPSSRSILLHELE